MAYVPNSGSVVAFQGTVPWSVLGNGQSVSGTVNVGNFPTNQNVAGSVVAFQGTSPWIVTGSVQASITPAANQSVSGTIGASVIGSVPVNVQGSVATVIIGGSIAASFTPPANQSVSGTIGASILGTVPVVLTSGSILAVPTGNQSVSGTVNVGSILTMQGYVSALNSISSQMSTSSVFTGTSEEVKDFSAIYVTVFSDVASATDGLSLQRSSNGTNWDITDTYTVPANSGKTYQIQPDARFFRVVYTNSAANQGAMRLQTIYKQSYSKPSSQRPSDGYTNETDLEQMQGFNMVYNGATWDRMRGTTAGALVTGSVQQGTTPWNVAGSIVTFQAGIQITSVVSTVPSSVLVGASIFGRAPISVIDYAGAGTPPAGNGTTTVSTPRVAIASDSAGPGSVIAFQGGTQTTSVISANASSMLVGNYAQRNDTVASFLGGDKTWNPTSTDSAGRMLSKPFAAEESRVEGYHSVVSTSVTTLIGSAGTGIRNYITDLWFVNTGATTAGIVLQDGLGSILGYAIAPAGGGWNLPGLATPIRTGAATSFDFKPLTASSILYGTAKGYKAP